MSHFEPYEDFPYDQVDRDLGFVKEKVEDERATEALRRFSQWIAQGDLRDWDGVFCRMTNIIWILCPQLSSYSMSKMAKRVGKKKQSLGRWVDDFKREFPVTAKKMKQLNNE